MNETPTPATRPPLENILASPWTNEFGAFWVPLDDLIVNHEFLTKGGWEMESVHFLRDRCFPQGVGTLIDVGAHFGLVSLPVALKHPGVFVHCFEPSPINFQILDHNVKAHHLEERVRLHIKAVSDCNGEAEIMWANENSVDHRLIPAAAQAAASADGIYRESTRPHGKVPVTTLAAALETFKLPRPIVMKLDVQGLECAVLRGLGEIQPDILIIEVWPYGLLRAGESLAELEWLLRKFKYGATLGSRYHVLRPGLHLELLKMLSWTPETYNDPKCAVGFDMVCALEAVP